MHVVCTGRHLPEDRVRQLADGRVYAGTEAKALGLVDELGYLEDAICCAKSMARIRDAAEADSAEPRSPPRHAIRETMDRSSI